MIGVIGAMLAIATACTNDSSRPATTTPPIESASTTEAVSSVAPQTESPPTASTPADTIPLASAPFTKDLLTELLTADFASLAPAPGALTQVLSPSRGIDVGAAVGVADVAVPRPLTDDATIRIASVTKSYTAAAVLRLVETRKLRLDDNLREAGVSEPLVDLLVSGGYHVDEITVEQLLTHTSGIADYVDYTDELGDGIYATAVLADPTREWTRTDQVRFAVDHHDPLATPGAEFHYSDTGFILLGEILETRTGLTFGGALRELLGFERLGMSTTYLESSEPVPSGAGARASQYLIWRSSRRSSARPRSSCRKPRRLPSLLRRCSADRSNWNQRHARPTCPPRQRVGLPRFLRSNELPPSDVCAASPVVD